jgi:hypothetical protein
MITIRQQYATQQQYQALLRQVRIQTEIITQLVEAHERQQRITQLETFNDYQEKQRVGGEVR